MRSVLEQTRPTLVFLSSKTVDSLVALVEEYCKLLHARPVHFESVFELLTRLEVKNSLPARTSSFTLNCSLMVQLVSS
jgi:hypothetical protein